MSCNESSLFAIRRPHNLFFHIVISTHFVGFANYYRREEILISEGVVLHYPRHPGAVHLLVGIVAAAEHAVRFARSRYVSPRKEGAGRQVRFELFPRTPHLNEQFKQHQETKQTESKRKAQHHNNIKQIKNKNKPKIPFETKNIIPHQQSFNHTSDSNKTTSSIIQSLIWPIQTLCRIQPVLPPRWSAS
jgi:hypothetical protein